MAPRAVAACRLLELKVHMRHRLLLATAALLTLAACADSPTAPGTMQPGAPSFSMSPGPDGTCRGGYTLATRSDGTAYCY